ncbi:Plastid transcriptionally active 6 [Rhynchospora pubera]|uniref:Plastid transcriptionally active 6 n=1 Tax=Rhynchospora pubera TaxID=906938 RepID=A0AAV8EFV6_9POAL|nr:Plastid transcriptionally active 6 [Rhynchospora pubera]KAJ4779977.1 Plastid transcriptionally active 6 [Rhynchospora pubera]KAJ4807487.1 Plastid transcriptionally active 6 [Rhynchospora pubera]
MIETALFSLPSSPSLLLCSRLSNPPKTLTLPVTLKPFSSLRHLHHHQRRLGRDLSVRAGGGDDVESLDFLGGDFFDFEAEDDDDNEEDYEIEYDKLLIGATKEDTGEDVALALAPLSSGGFVSTLGWEAETVVGYRINEEEFHKFSLLDCDFFIRKAPDPDDDVYDFREMYVSPPDTDVYSIPRVLAPMPKKLIRCSKKDYVLYNTTEPPVDGPRSPLYKTDTEILKVFLTKHYNNRRRSDGEFVLDFEEIYVIDSKAKSITRAKVIVSVPEGKTRDRRHDLLLIRDGGTSFKVINESERDDPQTVIEKVDWAKSRDQMEKYLRKFRDFEESNWF